MPEYCVTGGTGYIAAHLVKTLLDKGHTVRATVRDPGNLEKVGFLWDLQGAKERLKLMKADLLEEGSFDEAIKGVDGVFHTASPVVVPPYGDSFQVQETLIDPAVKGTLNVLNSCVRAGVKRVVLTSSTAAVRFRDDIQQISPLNESHWSDLDFCKKYETKEKMAEYCVTGGTGFIAAHLIKTLLEKGHTVRATVRDPGNLEKVGFLWELQGAKDRLKLVKADLLEEGSFDEAVEGVNGVFHTASPVATPPFGDNIQETLIDPAVKGTVNVLNSCIKAGVKRVVLTSSSSTTRGRDDVRQIGPLNESHWSDLDYCKLYKLWYAYSKTLAEMEAWKMANDSGLDLVVVVPSFVLGPLLLPHPTSSLQALLNIIKGTRGGIPDQIIGFVHVDDVISAHVLAMEESRASGRLICSGPVAHWLEIVELLKAKYPMYPYENQLITNQQGDANPHSNDTSKIVELGLPGFKTIPEMLDDCIRSFQDKGFLD